MRGRKCKISTILISIILLLSLLSIVVSSNENIVLNDKNFLSYADKLNFNPDGKILYVGGSGNNIDSNIHLTSKHLFLFRESVVYIDDPQIKEFIQQIIHLLEVKGNVDSSDIEEIVNILNLNAKIKGIHFLCLLRSTGFGTAYARGILPFIFESLFHNLFDDEFYIGPAIFVDWDSPNADTYINSRKIYDDDSQKGYIFGFLGLTLAGGIWPTYYSVIGFSTFVIITDLDSINENMSKGGICDDRRII